MLDNILDIFKMLFIGFIILVMTIILSSVYDYGYAVYISNYIKSLSNNEFWKEIEAIPTIVQPKNNPIILQGKTIFKTLDEAQYQMALACQSPSPYVDKYLNIANNTDGYRHSLVNFALDLGCGIGANTKVLIQRNWNIIAIDFQKKIIDELKDMKKQYHVKNVQFICQDITTYNFPENMDVIIAVDVLPYLPPQTLQLVLKKIYHSLKPNGQFIGTLFYRSRTTTLDNNFFELLGKLGAHFCPNIYYAREIIQRSGFKMIQYGPTDTQAAMEFYAIKAQK